MEEWGDWNELIQSTELSGLIDRANVALEKSSEGKGKSKKGVKTNE